MVQIRQTKSKQQIKHAITKLLQQKPFEEVTVTKICQTDELNRGTFYHHYEDKYDLMDKLKQDTLYHIYQFVKDTPTEQIHDLIYQIFIEANAEFDFIQVLYTVPYVNFETAVHKLIGILLQENSEDIEEIVEQYKNIPAKYAIQAYSGAISNVIKQWVLNGGEESPEEMTKIIYKVAFFGTREL